MKPWPVPCSLLALLLVVIGTPERPEAQVKTIAVRGTELAYLDMGQGPPVVMVHGTVCDYRWWQAQMDQFSQRHRVIAYSLRHHHPNVSTGDRSDYLPRTHAADLAGLIQALNLGRVHLIGHSYGSFISLLMARDRPELVRSLVLVEPGGGRLAGLITGADAEEAKPILKAAGESRKQVLERLDQGDIDEALRMFLDRALGPGTWARKSDAVRAAWRDNVHTLKPTLTNPAEPFSCDDARKIAAPTLLVGGDSSPRIVSLVGNALQPCLARAERITITKASHEVHRDNPADFNREVLAFLKRQ
jgi:pimeloyl-ACP methyl ester carboxylesterase